MNSTYPPSGFDRIAIFYDFLACLVFGKSIKKAQTEFLHLIPAGTRVLIIGGGTGWIIPELFHKSEIREIVFVDASAKMLNRAKKKIKEENKNKIQFVLGTESEVHSLGKFDVILTFFFLDLFPAKEQEKVGHLLYNSLNKEGKWLISDFEYGLKPWWQKALIKIMYLFFKIVCGINSSQLSNTKILFENLGLKLTNERFFYSKMMFARVYNN